MQTLLILYLVLCVAILMFMKAATQCDYRVYCNQCGMDITHQKDHTCEKKVERIKSLQGKGNRDRLRNDVRV